MPKAEIKTDYCRKSMTVRWCFTLHERYAIDWDYSKWPPVQHDGLFLYTVYIQSLESIASKITVCNSQWSAMVK